MTGQAAASLTAAFDSAVGITGAILTKLDGDSRGGAALSIRGVSRKPIKFVGVGEKTQDLEPFYPDRMASRILGMGDIVSLVEKAALEVSDADAARMQEKMVKAEFDFDDFMAQSKLVSSMGSMAGVAKMLPGLGNMIDNSQLRQVEQRIKRSDAMIRSMTKKERANPALLLTDRSARSRLMRITKGSGLAFEDVSDELCVDKNILDPPTQPIIIADVEMFWCNFSIIFSFREWHSCPSFRRCEQ